MSTSQGPARQICLNTEICAAIWPVRGSQSDSRDMNFPLGTSRLKKAIQRGLANGELRDALRDLGDLSLKSSSDADAICWGLQQLNRLDHKLLGQHASALAGLFGDIQDRDSPAFTVLQERGIPELLRLFDEISKAPSEEDGDTLMLILNVFAIYATVAGTLKIVEAARRPLKPDGFVWAVVLRNFTAGHPEKDLLFNSLRDPLPTGFIAVSLLQAANALLIEGDVMSHPFDTPEGRRQLREWLVSPDSEVFSYAHCATVALPFICNPERDMLLELASHHPDAAVRFEAAWAAAKIGREDGLQRLAEHCRDFKTAQMAKRYLSDLGREDAIPPEANDPGFSALAEFAQWLAHPNELGRLPDALEIVDHRELRWPPKRELKPFWLLKYTLRDTTGLDDDEVECGLVGSITFCFFSYKLAQRPPEDAYAVHCFWEMEKNGLIEESDVRGEPGEYDSLTKQWSGPALVNPKILFVAEVSPELRYPQRLIGLASARLQGEEGWVVLDGNRSEWYSRAGQPPDVFESVPLKIHVGRHLLGFPGNADRKKHLAPGKPAKPPEQIISAYEKLLAQAQQTGAEKRKESFDHFGPLGKHLDKYTGALRATGRASEIRAVVQVLAPHWDHVTGFGNLGIAAFKCGQLDLAEGFFLKYRDQSKNYERGEEMRLLAELWCGSGKHEPAKQLLLDCLRRLLQESTTATGSDKALFEEWFQSQRSAFLKLFPADAEALLAAGAIPSSTLRRPS